MKKLIIPMAVMAVIGSPNAANAYCTDWGTQDTNHYDLSQCSDESDYFLSAFADAECSTLDETYTTVWEDDHGCHYIKSCKTCPTGYTPEFTDVGWTYDDFCYNPDIEQELKNIQLEVNVCVKSCVSCTNCNSIDWTAYRTGYERRINRDCECDGTCTSTTQYRCAVGYYGTSTNGTSGCTRCPSSGGIYGTTAAAGSKNITSCYIPANQTMSDGTGEYVFTNKCYYKN